MDELINPRLQEEGFSPSLRLPITIYFTLSFFAKASQEGLGPEAETVVEHSLHVGLHGGSKRTEILVSKAT